LVAALVSCVFVVGTLEGLAQSSARREARPRTTNAPGRAEPTTVPAASQTPGDGNQASPVSTISTDEADLAITANVRARELRFEEVPNASVEFTGRPRRETVWEAERQNLPRPVRPGETYRDIGIRLRIISVFADIDRIVAEALGEVPVEGEREGASPASSPSPTPPTPTPTRTSTPPATAEAPASPALRIKGREATP
jgi:hypothetical protein